MMEHWALLTARGGIVSSWVVRARANRNVRGESIMVSFRILVCLRTASNLGLPCGVRHEFSQKMMIDSACVNLTRLCNILSCTVLISHGDDTNFARLSLLS